MLSKNAIIKHTWWIYFLKLNLAYSRNKPQADEKERDTKETTDSEIITKCGPILDSP